MSMVVPGVPVLYADEAMLVLDKPAGLLSVPGRGEDKQDCLSTRVQAVFADARVVHRLDMATSGLVLMARGLAAQRALSTAFEQRRVQKRYEARVHGHLRPDTRDVAPGDGWQTVSLPLALDWPQRPRSKVDPAGKPSVTRWRALDYDAASDTTRVALEPLTGRSHQLRVHLLALGHPIVGDALYGPEPNAAAAPSRLMLHAAELAFAHPADGQPVRFVSPVPF